MNASSRLIGFFGMCLLLASTAAHGSTVYLTVSGIGASGDISGTSFANANWSLEYAFDTGTVDSAAAIAESGQFFAAITSTHLTVNGVSHTLTGASAQGQIALASSAGTQILSVNPASGSNFLQWVSGVGTTFPSLFSDVNDLNSAVLGASINNTTADPYGNSLYLNFLSSYEYDYELGYAVLVPGLRSLSGDISIYAETPAGSGVWAASLSANSAFPPAPVPLPAAAWLMLSGLVGLGVIASGSSPRIR